MQRFMKSSLIWLWCSVLVIVADQVSKWWSIRALSGRVLKILPFLNFRLAFNHGAAFSFLSTAGGWQVVFFSVFSIIITVCLLIWLWKTPLKDRLQCVALSLVIGGAIGNVIDRVRYGFVVDFIDFHIGSWHYATFNLADTAICIGVFLLVIKLTFFKAEV